jgi:transposase InsO family protein
VRFTDFLRTTVLASASAATVLAALTVAGASGNNNDLLVPFSAGWWVAAALIGIWQGRRAETSPAIASLLSSARTQASLPHLTPARTMLNRLWPLLVSTVGACAVAFVVPQVPAVATGFAIIWSLAWRRQASAVRAIEERDGARFYVDKTSPFKPIRLVRTPGFRSNLFELNGASGHSRRARPRS